MKTIKKAKLAIASLACCVSGIAVSGSLLDGNTGIGSAADAQVTFEINAVISFTNTVWSVLAAYYSQNSGFAPVGNFNVDPSILPNNTQITNQGNGTEVVTFGANAPGPLANNSFALAPTCVTLRGSTFYVYELPQCFTNVTDSLTSASVPPPGTPISVFTKSNLGVKCVYDPSPAGAALRATNNCNSSSSPLDNGV